MDKETVGYLIKPMKIGLIISACATLLGLGLAIAWPGCGLLLAIILAGLAGGFSTKWAHERWWQAGLLVGAMVGMGAGISTAFGVLIGQMGQGLLPGQSPLMALLMVWSTALGLFLVTMVVGIGVSVLAAFIFRTKTRIAPPLELESPG